MKPVTVEDLYELCKNQIAKGNGDKTILISSDDEGNSFHTLFYTFTDELDTILSFEDSLPFKTDPHKVILLG